MASFGNRSAVVEAVNFVESCFPNAHTHQPTRSSTQPTQSGFSPPPPGIPANKYYQGLPQGPPPGLIRVCSPSRASTRLITNENVSLFGDFARYLDTGVDEDGNPVVLDLTCLICMDRKLQVPAAVTDHSQQARHEELAILPCGHFCGSNCLERWLISSGLQDNESLVHCPFCRFDLVYSCGHYIAPREYNPVMQRRRQVPLTLPEGGKMPQLCEICYKGNIDGAIDDLRDLLFPRVVTGDLRRPDSGEILRYTSVQFKRRVWDFWGLNVHYNRW